MWNILTQSDIERAKREIRARRAAVLQRQAREIELLEAERGELDTLLRLAGLFCRKFGRATAPPAPVVSRIVKETAPAPNRTVSGPPEETVAAEVAADEMAVPEMMISMAAKRPPVPPSPAARRVTRQSPVTADAGEEKHPGHRRRRTPTNFDMFWRAIEKSSF